MDDYRLSKVIHALPLALLVALIAWSWVDMLSKP